MDTVFERLTGKKYNSIVPYSISRSNEGIRLTHHKNGRTVLQYRGKTFDVTKKFSEIAR